MIEYKRFISYMYIYKKGYKDANVGFVKVESKNGVCRLSVNIKVYNITGKNVDIYVFKRGEDGFTPEKYLAGNLTAKNNICDVTYKTDALNVFSSGNCLDNLGGVIVIIDNDIICATEWDDKELCFSEDVTTCSVLKTEETDNCKEENIKEDIKENKEEIESIIDENEIQEIFISEEDIMNDYYEPEKEEKCMADRIFENYPGMYPFEDDEIMDCVKLEPRDIGILPMDKWILATNSFLLHGYYTYRHLIFARKKEEGQLKYLLGVPGIYRDRERFMAGMFGFSEFKCVRNVEKNTGDFGYWYMEIEV